MVENGSEYLTSSPGYFTP